MHDVDVMSVQEAAAEYVKTVRTEGGARSPISEPPEPRPAATSTTSPSATSCPCTTHLSRGDLVNYAGVAGDANPIHWDGSIAKLAGLPDVIAHGMLTMGLGIGFISEWTGDPGAVPVLGAPRHQPSSPADGRGDIEFSGRIKSLDPGDPQRRRDPHRQVGWQEDLPGWPRCIASADRLRRGAQLGLHEAATAAPAAVIGSVERRAAAQHERRPPCSSETLAQAPTCGLTKPGLGEPRPARRSIVVNTVAGRRAIHHQRGRATRVGRLVWRRAGLRQLPAETRAPGRNTVPPARRDPGFHVADEHATVPAR